MKVLPDLHVSGRGAVSPAGLGAWTLHEEPTAEVLWDRLLSQPEKSVRVYKVNLDQAPLLRWQQEPRLRRASPLALFLMEAASQALESQHQLDRSRLGLVCALGTGSIRYSRRFYAESQQRGRRFASPALFPETVYNSPVSHIAAILGIQDACYSLVGDESAWVEALRVAQVWLACAKVDHVLVLAGEELDIITVEAYERAGWLRKGVIPSEGAAALLVGASSGHVPVLRPDPVTHCFRSIPSHQQAWKTMVRLPADHPPLFLPGNVVPQSCVVKWGSAEAPRSGPDWGAAFTASSAWATVQMIQAGLTGTLLVPGCNSGVSRLQIRSGSPLH
jgi:hypothetical protein